MSTTGPTERWSWVADSMERVEVPPQSIDGRWVVGAELGRGGFGYVHAAEEVGTGRKVAVKIIAFVPKERRPRLQRELRALEMFSSPGVVALLDHGPLGPGHYIVMERLPSVRFPGPARKDWSDLRPAAMGLFEALAHVHDRGIVHRDLKPANVLMRGEQPVLLDFGLARGDGIGSTLTRTGTRMGTLRYVSPEQGMGQRVTLRTDLYSAGVMLFEALTGSLPHEAEDAAALLRARVTRAPRPVSSLRPDLDPEAASVIDALLATDPTDRPPHAHAVLELLAAHSPTRLQWLGSAEWIDGLVDRLQAGERVLVGGGAGSGRSRALQEVAACLPHHWLRPGQRPFESLGTVLDGLDLQGVTSGAEARDRARARLREEVGASAVLLIDGVKLDWSSRQLVDEHRGPVLEVVDDAPAALVPPRLEVEGLRSLFSGPDRVLHLREDAATELLRRTDGLPRQVVAELTAWRRAGLSRREGELDRVDRATLDRLRSESPPRRRAPPSQESSQPLPRHLDDLLCAVEVAGVHAVPEHLAQLSELAVWQLDEALSELEDRGHIRRDGLLSVALGPAATVRWTDTERRQAHATLAEALPLGARGRLHHMVEGCVAVGIVDESLAEARALERSGYLAEARGWLEKSSRAVEDGAELRPVLLEHARMSLDLADGTASREAMKLLRDRPLGAGEHLLRLADAIDAVARRKGHDALAILGEVPPFEDRRLEAQRQRHLNLVAQRMVAGSDVEMLASIAAESWPAPWPDVWEGLLAFRAGDLPRAAKAQWRAAASEERAAQRIRLKLRAASTWSGCGRRELAQPMALEGLEEARERRLPVLELRAEWALRWGAHKRGVTAVDEELVAAAMAMPMDVAEAAQALLGETYVAWRAGALGCVGRLASAAARRFRVLGTPAGVVISDGLAFAAAGQFDRVEELIDPSCPVASLDLLRILSDRGGLRAGLAKIRRQIQANAPSQGWKGIGLFTHERREECR